MTLIHSLTSSRLIGFAVAALLLALVLALVSLAVLDAIGADHLLGPRIGRLSVTAGADTPILVAARRGP